MDKPANLALAVGLVLFFLGVVLRGLARHQRRTLAARKLDALDSGGQADPDLRVLARGAKTLAILGNTALVAGIGVIIASWFG